MDVEDRAMTISELIDDRPLGRFQVLTVALCGVVLVLDGLATQSIGFLAPSIAQSLHVPVKTFGPVFASALFGLMISSLLSGPLADRVGRKVPTVAATLIFAAFTVATPLASTLNQLVVLRFLTGLGLGAAIPNVVALVTEYSPRRLQQVVVTVLFCGMPFGALLGGMISVVVLPRWGWQRVFEISGLLPFLLAIVLIGVLPESLRFLSVHGTSSSRAAKILARLAPDLPPVRLAAPPPDADQKIGAVPVVDLFTGGRAIGTVLLWLPFFMNLLLLYFIVNWLPALLRQTHMPLSAGILSVSLFSLGGMLGSVLQGYAMKAYGNALVLLVEFLLCLPLVCSLAFVTSLPPMMAITFVLGCFVQGAQAGINAITATFYPTAIRSTGVGWALGIGRFGSILGPILGGLMLSRAWSLRSIFLAGSLPALAAALAILVSLPLQHGRNPYRSA